MAILEIQRRKTLTEIGQLLEATVAAYYKEKGGKLSEAKKMFE